MRLTRAELLVELVEALDDVLLAALVAKSVAT